MYLYRCAIRDDSSMTNDMSLSEKPQAAGHGILLKPTLRISISQQRAYQGTRLRNGLRSNPSELTFTDPGVSVDRGISPAQRSAYSSSLRASVLHSPESSKC